MPRDAAVVADAGEGGPRITFTIKPARAKGTALGKRCTIAGEPLVASCIGGPEGLALDTAGVLWVVSGTEVRRYRRADGADCRYEPAGEPVALPAENPRPQPLDKGPVYMRSGGAAWHLVAAPGAIYAHDYLGGMFRIDRGKAEPACVDVFGYESAAALGGKLLVARKGIEQLALGPKCKASPAKLGAPDLRGTLHVLGGVLHVATRDHALVRLDGTASTTLAADAKLCSVWTAFACGDGACLVDGNCRAILQLDADGKTLRKLEHDALFEPVPWSIPAAVTRADGTVVLLARLRDGHGAAETCEGALYELPPALFAR